MNGSLFIRSEFQLHSGGTSDFKIECDSLTDEDIQTVAWLISNRVPAFSTVEGVPTGGLRLATALQKYATTGPILVVDDVLTTGRSMEEYRAGRRVSGAVIFARQQPPPWIMGLFTMEN